MIINLVSQIEFFFNLLATVEVCLELFITCLFLLFAALICTGLAIKLSFGKYKVLEDDKEICVEVKDV